jgi:hypothetical protein
MGNVKVECEFDPNVQPPDVTLQQCKEAVRLANFGGDNSAYKSLVPTRGPGSGKVTGLMARVDPSIALDMQTLLTAQFGVFCAPLFPAFLEGYGCSFAAIPAFAGLSNLSVNNAGGAGVNLVAGVEIRKLAAGNNIDDGYDAAFALGGNVALGAGLTKTLAELYPTLQANPGAEPAAGFATLSPIYPLFKVKFSLTVFGANTATMTVGTNALTAFQYLTSLSPEVENIISLLNTAPIVLGAAAPETLEATLPNPAWRYTKQFYIGNGGELYPLTTGNGSYLYLPWEALQQGAV